MKKNEKTDCVSNEGGKTLILFKFYLANNKN